MSRCSRTIGRLVVNEDDLNCDFSYAKLIGYDFMAAVYPAPNNIVYTDLSECCPEGADLTTGALIFPNLNETKLKGALIKDSQPKFIKLSPKQQQEIRKIIIEDWGD